MVKYLPSYLEEFVFRCYFYFSPNKKGSFLRRKCTKGRNCNYLHVFRNPYNEYKYFPSTDCGKHPEKSSLRRTNKEGVDKSNAWSSGDEHDEKRVTTKWETDDDREKRTWSNRESKSSPVRSDRSTGQDSRSKKHRESNSHHKKKNSDKHTHEDRNRGDYSKERMKSKNSSHRY